MEGVSISSLELGYRLTKEHLAKLEKPLFLTLGMCQHSLGLSSQFPYSIIINVKLRLHCCIGAKHCVNVAWLCTEIHIFLCHISIAKKMQFSFIDVAVSQFL